MYYDTDSVPLRIVGIDQGTDKLGISVSEYDYGCKQLRIVDATTIRSDILVSRYYTELVATRGDRLAKMHAIRKAVTKYLYAWNPTIVGSEGPYMARKTVTAYGSGIEILSVLRHALHDYNPYMPLHVIDPARVKVAVGVDGRSKDKEDMRRAIRKHPLLSLELDIDAIGPDAVDAIAVGTFFYRQCVLGE